MAAVFFFFIMVFSIFASGDKSPWKLSSSADLTFTLNSYSEGWKGKESGSLLWVAQTKSLASKQLTDRLHNESTLKLAFGQTKVQDRETKRWSAPQKSTDVVDLQSVLHLKLNGLGDPFFSLRVIGQFYDIRDSNNIRYGNPITATKTFGLAKELIKRPDMNWNIRLGGAMRSNIDRNALIYEEIEGIKTATGTSTSLITDAGTEMVSKFKMKRDDWLTLAGKLTLYKALLRPGTQNNNDWLYPDISYDQTLSINVTKHIVVNHALQLLYDREKNPDPHFRQTLSAGLSVSFSNKHFKKGK
ncbi:MAG: hypothetical protein ACLFVQ_01290 [Chitinispirillaceae bacterium]